MVIILFQERYHKSTEKYRKYCGTGTGDLVGSRGVHRHPYCRGLSLKRQSALGDLWRPLEGPGGSEHRQGPSGVDPEVKESP